ncbi:MAG: hypothetical protein ACYDCF_10115, partial [Burkholderiales bacterium]
MANYTLTGNGQTFTSATQPVYDTAFRFWRCQDSNGNAFNVSDPTGSGFTVSGTVYPILTPMQFYDALTPQEETAILASVDPLVQTFARRMARALQTNTPVNPNLQTVQEGLTYLSTANQNPAPAAAWAQNTAVTVGQQRAVGTNVYTCTTAGTTATSGTGPSGTGTG